MTTKNKNNKVPKSVKTRLSDLTPKKDARAGKYAPLASKGPGVGLTPPIFNPPPSSGASSTVKRQVTA
jgi:hypothetical protein